MELNSKELHQSSGKEKERCSLLLTSSTKREIRQFHVVVVQRRHRDVQLKGMMHLQSCCFACLNLAKPIAFFPLSLPSPSSLCKLPNVSPHVKESAFRNPCNFCCGILGFGIKNTAQRIRNPTKDWNPDFKFH